MQDTTVWHCRSLRGLSDTPAAPLPRTLYARSHGESALHQHHRASAASMTRRAAAAVGAAACHGDKSHDDDECEALPALLRPQFAVLDADVLQRIEQRMQYDARLQQREAHIDARADAAAARVRSENDARAAQRQRRTQRHVAAAEAQARKRVEADYRTLCRW